MAKKKIRILNPTGALARGIEAEPGAIVNLDEKDAAELLELGFAEEIKVERAVAKPSQAK